MTELPLDSPLRANLAAPPLTLRDGERPEPGPVSVIPAERAGELEPFAAEFGGSIVPLGPNTRGLVALGYRDRDAIARALETYPGISWLQVPSAGIDGYVSVLRSHADRLLVTTGKGIASEPVAEHALALTLGVLRDFPKRIRATSWGENSGTTLFGANVVIVGAGGIARSYLELVRPFRVTTTVVRKRPVSVPEADRTVTIDELHSVLPDADVLVLAAAATERSRGLIGELELRILKPTAVLVNIARGSLIDQDALLAALGAGRLAGAGLDVTVPEPLPSGHPLFMHERVIVTPHTADTVELMMPLVRQRVRENLEGFWRTGTFAGVADVEAGY